MAGKTAALGEGLLEVPLRPAGERDLGWAFTFAPASKDGSNAPCASFSPFVTSLRSSLWGGSLATSPSEEVETLILRSRRGRDLGQLPHKCADVWPGEY